MSGVGLAVLSLARSTLVSSRLIAASALVKVTLSCLSSSKAASAPKRTVLGTSGRDIHLFVCTNVYSFRDFILKYKYNMKVNYGQIQLSVNFVPAPQMKL